MIKVSGFPNMKMATRTTQWIAVCIISFALLTLNGILIKECKAKKSGNVLFVTKYQAVGQRYELLQDLSQYY